VFVFQSTGDGFRSIDDELQNRDDGKIDFVYLFQGIGDGFRGIDDEFPGCDDELRNIDAGAMKLGRGEKLPINRQQKGDVNNEC